MAQLGNPLPSPSITHRSSQTAKDNLIHHIHFNPHFIYRQTYILKEYHPLKHTFTREFVDIFTFFDSALLKCHAFACLKLPNRLPYIRRRFVIAPKALLAQEGYISNAFQRRHGNEPSMSRHIK
jgi:hypothetical protein